MTQRISAVRGRQLATWLLSGLAVFLYTCVAAHSQDEKPQDWRTEWELAEGLNIEIDSQGFALPAHIVFVPEPGKGPKDPLYFIIELKGTIKVVTNDRSVHTFAENFLPTPQGESFVATGATNICLDPVNGYVFASFAYQDKTLIYRNGMARFSTKPGEFGLRAEKTDLFLDLFKDEVSDTSHQIGPCAVKDDHLYVMVGYGRDRTQSQNLHTTLGSIIRMTRDFEPVDDNPFFTDDGQTTAIDYIWAYGFRNPYGIKFVGDRLFATENGGGADRFNEIEAGENYLYDGTDWGIGARAAQAFVPAIGIVDLEFIPESSSLFPENLRGRFVAAAAGAPGTKGEGELGTRSVVLWNYDLDDRRMTEVPRVIVRYRGKGPQIPVSVTLGPDGLYFAALFPNPDGTTPIYKITYDPEAGYPYRLGQNQSPQALINKFGCRQCHIINRRGGKFGPPIDETLSSKLEARLSSPDYAAQVEKMNRIEHKPYVDFREARDAIIAVEGQDRVRRWLPVYLREPRFDNPDVQMPALGLSPAEADIIAEYLLKTAAAPVAEQSLLNTLRATALSRVPELRYRHVAMAFLVGALGGAAVLFMLLRILRRRIPDR